MLEIEFNELREAKSSPLKAIFGLQTKSEIAFENKAKLNNLKIILEDILKEIENKNFIKANFFLLSTNYDPNGPTNIAQLARKDSITYNFAYDENYFQNIKEEKILPLLSKVSAELDVKKDNLKNL